MRFASTIVQPLEGKHTKDQLLDLLSREIPLDEVNLAIVFVCTNDEDEFEELVEGLHRKVNQAVILGCTTQGTIGTDKEIEGSPSVSLLAASLPDVFVRPFHIRQRILESTETLADWERIVGVLPESQPTFIALADPFRIDIPLCLDRLGKNFPGAPLVGGVVSGAREPDGNRMVAGNQVVRDGIVGVALSGSLAVRTVVSQGCRPIGRPFVITKGQRNIIQQLGGRAPMEQLHRMLAELPSTEEELARQSLLLGRVIDERKDHFTRGDFLVQNIIGVDRASGAIGIAGEARVGATIQFHVRDAQSADEDLRGMLGPHADFGTRGALLFGCNGRGSHMWPEPGHDAGVIRDVLGDVPLAGFFCAGELGPIGGRNFIHGFTASIALFAESNSPVAFPDVDSDETGVLPPA